MEIIKIISSHESWKLTGTIWNLCFPHCNKTLSVHIMCVYMISTTKPSTYSYISHIISSLGVFQLKFVFICHLSRMCYIPLSSHPTQFDHPTNIWQFVQIIMQFSPASGHFLLLRSNLFSPVTCSQTHSICVLLSEIKLLF